MDEVEAIRLILNEMRNMIQKRFIKNQWAELYDKLGQISTPFCKKTKSVIPCIRE